MVTIAGAIIIFFSSIFLDMSITMKKNAAAEAPPDK